MGRGEEAEGLAKSFRFFNVRLVFFAQGEATMRGPADELKREHERLGRQMTVREAIPFLESRDAEAAHMLRALGVDYLDRPIFVHGESGRIREVRPCAVPSTEPNRPDVATVGHALTYVRIEADEL
jgi:hypothetical protein